jgi:hypothetical protein
MFARYLQLALTVEQIGYCDRISESAVQYAKRLLSTKPQLVLKASAIAKELVHEYKDHGFVIDIEEARMQLGADWIKSDTAEFRTAERIYSLFEMVNLFLEMGQSKRLFVMGSVIDTSAIRMVKSRSRSAVVGVVARPRTSSRTKGTGSGVSARIRASGGRVGSRFGGLVRVEGRGERA